MEAADERAADVRAGTRPHRHHHRSQRSEADVCGGPGWGCRRPLSIGRRGTELVQGDRGLAGRQPRRRLRRGQGPSEKPRHRVHRQHRVVEIDRRRQDVQVIARRARRRRLPPLLDQSRQPRHHPRRGRSGRRDHGERRRDVELLVQPADRAVLPRQHRQRVSVPRLRRPAGERVRVRAEPRRRRADHVPRVASGRRRGVRLRRARSARPRHRLWRQGDALQPQDRRSDPGRAARRARGSVSRDPHAARAVLADRSAHALLRVEPAVEDDQRRHARLDADQPGPHAQDVGGAGERRDLQGIAGGRTPTPARRHLHDRAGLHLDQPDLGRHRRRADPHDARTAG